MRTKYSKRNVINVITLGCSKNIFDSDCNQWRVASLRYFNPVGAHPSGLIGENPKGKPKTPKAGDRRPGVTEDRSFVEFMKRIEHLPDVTKEAIKNCGDDPLVAKAALEISGLPK